MTKDHHGSPCWYELSTTPGNLRQTGAFYKKVFGWTFRDAGMEGFTYHLASIGGTMVAGAMEMPEDTPDMPPFWMLYFAVSDADTSVAEMVAAGAKLHRPVMPIPGTGRFALLADPTGAGFGILEPLPMEGPDQGGAFDQKKPGHGAWHELMSTDPGAAMAFYGKTLGWTPGQSMPMGEMGSYDLFQWHGRDVGGMMRKAPGMPGPVGSFWLPYFGVKRVAAAMKRITAGGGTVLQGPHEVPGGAYIAIARDPQGAQFALTGPK
ncbi:MAG: VOC family protein [Defluviimonas sp.]|nr:VOC family protein [Paracoccaceae bacterium]MCC0063792.1 VOC family protein [Defluviimonas sp.]